MSDNAWRVVKNTPKVTRARRRQADALTKESTRSPSQDRSRETEAKKCSGEQVRINEGPFTGFNGVVDEVNLDRRRAEGDGHDLRRAFDAGRTGLSAGGEGSRREHGEKDSGTA